MKSAEDRSCRSRACRGPEPVMHRRRRRDRGTEGGTAGWRSGTGLAHRPSAEAGHAGTGFAQRTGMTLPARQSRAARQLCAGDCCAGWGSSRRPKPYPRFWWRQLGSRLWKNPTGGRTFGTLSLMPYTLSQLASRQCNVARRDQLLTAGVTLDKLRAFVDGGRWTPLGPVVVAMHNGPAGPRAADVGSGPGLRQRWVPRRSDRVGGVGPA
jgi:hypothetical protein